MIVHVIGWIVDKRMPTYVLSLICVFVAAQGSATPYFVTTNGSDLAAGTSWGTAFLTLSNAVANAGDADTISVSNGTYTITTTLLVSAGMTLVGVDGYTNTLISIQLPSYGAIPGVKIAHSNAVLRGFTITHSLNQFNYNQYGPLYLEDGIVEQCLLTGNTNRSVGGIYMTGGTLRNSTITKNRAVHWNTGLGGGVRMTGGVVSNCMIYGNRSADAGGGVAMWGSSKVVFCTITNNYADRSSSGQGGGVYINNGTLENCLVTKNRLSGGLATKGGGISMVNGIIRYCTIVDNTRPGGDTGAGLYMTGGAVTNCIMYHNGTIFPASGTENVDQSGGTIGYSCMQPLVAGTGNTEDSPDFVDRSINDYHLVFGSVCIDSATNLPAVSVDLEFNSRPKDGDGDSFSSPDMGCYEADTAGAVFACTFDATPLVGTNSSEVVFIASVVGPGTNSVTYYWDFNNDGTNDQTTSTGTATNTYLAGTHSVKLICTNALSQTATKTKTDFIFVWPSTTYVASAGAAISPYDTWAKAATEIQNAVNAVVVGGTVLLSNEIHTISTKIILTRAMTITSVGSAADTVIKSPGSVRIMDITDPGVILEKVTLTGISLGYPNSGAINMTGGTVRYCWIIGNTLGTKGGGIHMEGGLVHDCIITNNVASHVNTGYGGGVYMTGGVVSNCLISNNRAVDGAGGLEMEGGLVVFCTITNNYATRSNARAGGVYLYGGGTIANCLITHNRLTHTSAATGGGVYMTGGAMVNCTVADNWRVGGNNYAGLYITGGVVTNSIFYRNSSTFPAFNLENVYRNGGSITYSCMQPIVSGIGNINVDPMFEGRSTNNYRLAYGSECVDAGTNVSWVSADLDGNNRPKDGDGNSSTNIDLGCYERDAGGGIFVCNFSGTPTLGTNSLQTVFTAIVGGPGTGTVTYCWDWTNDGTNDLVGTTYAVATNTYPEPGYYNVRLTCTNALSDTAKRTKIAYILVYSTNSFVSTNGTDTFPYNTWEGAADSVSDALDVVPAGGTVFVTNGTYSVSFVMTLDKKVTIRSINGASNTVLSSTSPQIFRLRHTDAIVDGFLLRGAVMTYGNYGVANLDGGTLRNCIITANAIGSCGGVYMDSGLVENCIITNNYANHWNTGFGGGMRMTGGTVSNCVIRDNRAMDGGGGIYMTGGIVRNCDIDSNRPVQNATDCAAGGVWIAGGLLYNCNIRSNWVVTVGAAGGGGVWQTGGTVRNCLISGNAVTNFGGGVRISGGLLENCTVVENSSANGGGVYMIGGGITNSIIYANNASAGTNVYLVSGSIGYSCSPDLTESVNNNIVKDPLFFPSDTSDYWLGGGSPCIDTGLDMPWMVDALDLGGYDRILRVRVDMGTYENKLPPGTYLIFR